jgi:outer membrane protein assembly factor BamD
MFRRIPVLVLLATLALTIACTNKKSVNPIANVDSKQPDKVLFDRSMNAMKHNQFDVARMTLQTLINTYPDSEFLARAKLALGDSWYAEGGSTGMAQAEAEYNDFITFFPNMPEAAEAQLKIANIHFNEMEKPDRDFTHALRAEEEYRKVIMQYPDNKQMVEAAKQKLLIVQEVLAEREYRVGHFYYMQGSYPAAIARLKSMVETYPLYSKADEALFTLGQSYEQEIARLSPMKTATAAAEAQKAAMLDKLTAQASAAYDEILTRYPVMDRALDAKARLVALHQPVPHPTKAMVAQNRAEEASRRENSMLQSVLGDFSHHPDTAEAARVGEPTLVDPKQISATDVIRQATVTETPKPAAGGNETLGVTVVGQGDPPPSDAVPHSDTAPPTDSANTDSANNVPTPAPEPAPAASAANVPASAGTDSGELKPNVAGNAPASNDPNELKPNVADNAATPPPQVNEIQQQGSTTKDTAQPANAADQQTADDSVFSSSKKDKKKGLKKVIPF